MNKDNLRTLIKNVDSDLFELINHVICSICQELLTKPVTTPCGHSFCSGCIKRVISSKNNSGCPLCKNPVKRYSLDTDKAKSTLTEIFRELPAAFEKDVEDLSANLNDTAENLIKNSKLAQLTGQDYEKDVKSNKQKTSVLKKSQKPSNKSENAEANDNDVESFVPVLKRSKNVIEYASAKKKKMDDLVSISQREVESDSGACDTSGLDKKLEQMEKVSPEEKINEWFKAVGSNIYLNSPSTNYIDSPPAKNVTESQVSPKDGKEGCSTNNGSAMVTRNYKKVANLLHSKENEKESDTKIVTDPYEFVPSQNSRFGRRRKRKCLEKKVPDFKALLSFSKESVKRNMIILDGDQEDGEGGNEAEISVGKSSSEFPAVTLDPDVITASQKFDKLLSESKENEKKRNVKAHVLYSASQASSTQFLDCSYQSKKAEVKKARKRRRSGVSFKKTRKSVSSSEQESFSNLIPQGTRFSEDSPNTRTKNVGEEGSARSKRKHSLDSNQGKADERQPFSEIMDLKSEEALDLEKSVEEYLMKFKKDSKSLKGTCDKSSEQSKTKLIELLGELVNDDIVYKNHPRNAPVELRNQRKAEEINSKVSSCEKSFQQTKTKLTELLEELINDNIVYKNRPTNSLVGLKNRRQAEEKDLKVTSCEKISQQRKTKLMELLGELVNDDILYKNHPKGTPVKLKNRRSKAEEREKDLKVTSCEKISQQRKTKLIELLEELVNDETVYQNNPRDTPVELENRSKVGEREKDSKVSSCQKTSQQTKTKLIELLEELVNDNNVYKNRPTNTPVGLINGRQAEGKGSEVSSCQKTSQQTKTKLTELLEELINDDIVYRNSPVNTPVGLENRRQVEKKELKVTPCEKISPQTKTKLTELLEELVNDEAVYQNHPRETPVELENRRSNAEAKENDSKVTSCQKTSGQIKTNLTELLEELVNDEVVYKNHPRNAPVELKTRRKAEEVDMEKSVSSKSSPHHTSSQNQNLGYNSKGKTLKPMDDLKSGKFTQGTHLLGFGTQEELVDEKMFKEMVNNMEKELELSESDLKRTPLGQCGKENNENRALNNSYDKESPSPNPKLSRNESANSSFITFNFLGKVRRNKSCFINFLRLGRLNPTIKRSRSSVVKLVFPIGLSSFARKRVIQDRLSKGIINTSKFPLLTNQNKSCVSSSRTDHVSTGIQTSQRLVSSAEIQTSHISKSVIVQTSQVFKPSVEIQTVEEKCCAGIQTSQIPSPDLPRIYKSAEIQTTQPPCESCRPNLTLLRDNLNDIETEYIPGSVGYDEPEFLPKKSNSRHFEGTEYSFRKLRRSKERTCCLEKDINEMPSPSGLSNKRKNLSPPKKHFYKHRKISRKSFEKEKSCSPGKKSPEKIDDSRSQDKPCTSSLMVDSEMKREFEETWVRKSEKSHEDLVETKNKRNRGEEEVNRESKISSPTGKQENSPCNLSQNLSGLIDEVLQKFETRQRIPLNVRKVSSDDDCEVIDLGTPEIVQQSSQDQVNQVLKNIDLDLRGKGNKKGNGKEARTSENVGNSAKGEKSEESDSDFFVEQTPPRPSNSRTIDQESVNSSRFEGRRSSCLEKVEREEDDDEKKVLVSQGTDLIGDSLPKDATEGESFLMVSAPQKVLLTPEKRECSNVTHFEKRGKSGSQSFPKEKSFSTIQKVINTLRANENDQNQLNGASETKSNQSKTWLKVDESPHVKVSAQSKQKLCVVASSVKNLDMIKKFVIKFKMEYSNKPTKNMTHLIVGLHESEEEGEVLPLCTPKLLFAMANKKWIVSEAWAETCLKMDTIVPEEAFEALDPVGGQGCRNARTSTQPLLKDCEIYLLGNFQAISKEDFAGLILDCGGTVIQTPEQFSFSPLKLRMIVADQDCLNMDKNQLQELHEKYSTVILSRDVILMSIQSYKLANFNPHLLHPTSEDDLLKMGYPSQLVKSEEEESSSNWNNTR